MVDLEKRHGDVSVVADCTSPSDCLNLFMVPLFFLIAFLVELFWKCNVTIHTMINGVVYGTVCAPREIWVVQKPLHRFADVSGKRVLAFG